MNALYGEYPIVIGGEITGVLTVSKDGPMTVFRARCKNNGKLLRLSVYGESEGYLGVMQPEGENYVLVKRLSRAALEKFPQKISCAGEAGDSEMYLRQEQPVPEEDMENNAPEESAEENTQICPEVIVEKSPEECPQESAERSPEEKSLLWREMPDPWALFADLELKKLFQKTRGVLISKQEDRLLIAVPTAGNDSFPPLPVYVGGVARTIEGRQYVVFELKNGKII
jgi:hypothetical protein